VTMRSMLSSDCRSLQEMDRHTESAGTKQLMMMLPR
jgi:hypothetical protein